MSFTACTAGLRVETIALHYVLVCFTALQFDALIVPLWDTGRTAMLNRPERAHGCSEIPAEHLNGADVGDVLSPAPIAPSVIQVFRAAGGELGHDAAIAKKGADR
jgi:hypothetical protein